MKSGIGTFLKWALSCLCVFSAVLALHSTGRDEQIVIDETMLFVVIAVLSLLACIAVYVVEMLDKPFRR